MTNPDKKRYPECVTFVDARGIPAVFLFMGGSLGKEHVFRLRNMLHGKQFEKLDLVIHSGGGDIHAAYQVIELLRMHTNTLNACVPLYAKSAATLLCLGCDTIFLDEMAELGPLDTQIVEQKKGGKIEFTSALNPFKTLEQLQKHSVETLDICAGMIAVRSGMDLDECIKHAIQFVGVTTGPLFDKLDPEKLCAYSRALAIGHDYAERLTRRYKSWDEEKRWRILEKLVHGYPSHEYIIDFKELQEIGVESQLFDGKERQACRKLIDVIRSEDEIVQIIEPNPKEAEDGQATGSESAQA